MLTQTLLRRRGLERNGGGKKGNKIDIKAKIVLVTQLRREKKTIFFLVFIKDTGGTTVVLGPVAKNKLYEYWYPTCM